MKNIYSTTIQTKYGDKEICVKHGNIITLEDNIDILTISAFQRNYFPTVGTMYKALYDCNIDVDKESLNPLYDLRDNCNIWLSKDIHNSKIPVKRIGCIEMEYDFKWNLNEDKMLQSITAYFHMLDLASAMDMEMDTIAMPMLGTGSQDLDTSLIVIPILTECINFLKRNKKVKKIYFFDISEAKVKIFVEMLNKSYIINNTDLEIRKPKMAFISYSSLDREIAEEVKEELKKANIKVWIDKDNISLGSEYTEEIYYAIKKASHFIVIITPNSLKSKHVLREVALASDEYPHNIKILTLFNEDIKLTPSFIYYLSINQHQKLYVPPKQKRIEEVAETIIKE